MYWSCVRRLSVNIYQWLDRVDLNTNYIPAQTLEIIYRPPEVGTSGGGGKVSWRGRGAEGEHLLENSL
jgi:hypothetical protein